MEISFIIRYDNGSTYARSTAQLTEEQVRQLLPTLYPGLPERQVKMAHAALLSNRSLTEQ
jgi:hypothetical protein